MVKLATEPYPQLLIDDRECKRQGKSYTIDTLASFRNEFPQNPLAFITGMDAYLDIPNWKQWQDYLEYVHICVMRRPGYEFEPSWGDEFVACCQDELKHKSQGLIYFANSELVDISSTQIREKLKTGQSANAELPVDVINYIIENELYANT